jgi:hypothetical protein
MAELEELRAWLVDVLSDERARFELRRRGIGSEERCGVFRVEASADVGRLAEEIMTRAVRDARHFRGPQSYIVAASQDEEGGNEVRTVVEVAGGRDVAERGGDIELASTTGLLGQLMRHNESDQKSISGQFSAVFAAYEQLLAARDRIIEQRDKRIAELEARELKVHELFERLTTAEHERRIELLRIEQADKRAAFAQEKIDMLLPVLGSKVGTALLGPGKPGQPPLFGEEMLKQFLGSLDMAQVNAIESILRPEQIPLIAQLYNAYAERDAQAKKAAANASGVAPAETSSPTSNPPSAPTPNGGAS